MTMTWNGHKLTAGMRLAIMRGLLTVGGAVRNEAVSSIIKGPKTGIAYRRRGVVHVASAPGEPPANDLGNLQSGITVVPNPALLMVTINSGASYSAALEYGTVKMAPRPFMRRALLKHLPTLRSVVSAEVARYLASAPK